MKAKSFPWLRLYAETVNDPKLKLLDFGDRWQFIAVLCLKRMGVLDSDAPHRERRIAVSLGLQVNDAAEVKRRLRDVGLIDENWQPLAWAKRQFTSDANGAERMRKHRSKKVVKRHSDNGVTSRVTKSDAADIREEKSQNQNPESEKSQSSSSYVGGVGSAEGSARKRAPARPSRRMPATYEPSTELLAWATTEAPLVNFRNALDTIRDHEFRTAHSDWDAVVRNWLRRDQRAAEDRPARGTRAPAQQPMFRDDDTSLDGVEL